MFKIAFAGFRHNHILGLYNIVKESDRVKIVGAWEDDTDARNEVINNYGVNFNYSSYSDMLSTSGADIIAIGDYYGIRGHLAIKALESGKHLIADKPVCTSLKELDIIEKMSSEKNLQVGIMLDLRYNDAVCCAKRIIEDGTIGEVNNIYFGGQHPLMYGTRPSWYFEEGKYGGVINDIAIHGIDLVTYLTGLEYKETVGVRSWNFFAKEEKDFKDSAQFMYTLNNGAGVLADVSYSVPNSFGYSMPCYWAFQIWGTKGMMSFGVNESTVDLYLDGNDKVLSVVPEEKHLNYLDDYLDCIEGKHCLLTTKGALTSSRATLEIQRNDFGYESIKKD